MRGIALAFSVTDHDDFATEGYGVRDLFVIRGLFRRSLSAFAGLVLMHKMMKEVMGVVRSDDMLRGVVGRDVDTKDFCPVMIHDDQETWRNRFGMLGRLRRMLLGKPRLREEMPKLDHLGTRKILAVRFSHDVTCAGDLEHKLAVTPFMGVANFRDQSNNLPPFQIMCRRMMEYRFECVTMRARYRQEVSGHGARISVGLVCFHDAFLIGRKRFRFVRGGG